MKDSRWKNVKIGNSTIGKIGCVVCSIAEVESYMRGGNVYPSQIKKEYKFDKNGNIYWGSKYKSGGTPYLTDIYNSIVYDNRPVIAKLSSREHWIVIMGVENVGFTAQGKPDLYPSNFIVQDAGTTKAKKHLSDYGMKNYKGLSRMMIRK